MRTLIRDATVVFPDSTVKLNVLIEGHRIASIDAPDSSRADEVVEANGLHLMPGLIDDQVHFREPGLTHKEDLHHATRACAKGGVTSFLEMPNTKPTTTTEHALEEKLAIAQSHLVPRQLQVCGWVCVCVCCVCVVCVLCVYGMCVCVCVRATQYLQSTALACSS